MFLEQNCPGRSFTDLVQQLNIKSYDHLNLEYIYNYAAVYLYYKVVGGIIQNKQKAASTIWKSIAVTLWMNFTLFTLILTDGVVYDWVTMRQRFKPLFTTGVYNLGQIVTQIVSFMPVCLSTIFRDYLLSENLKTDSLLLSV